MRLPSCDKAFVIASCKNVIAKLESLQSDDYEYVITWEVIPKKVVLRDRAA